MNPAPRPTPGSDDNARPRRIVVATGNPHKLDEIRAVLAAAGVEVTLESMREHGVEAPPEDGETFAANALIKARACAAATGLDAVADDSGLEVDALDGAPGVHSARYAGVHGDDAANNAKLVASLADVPPAERTARFVCAAALVTADGAEHVEVGRMPGRIIDTPRGAHGFGYDPHFVADAADGRTNAELSGAEKDAISHRGAAFAALARRLTCDVG